MIIEYSRGIYLSQEGRAAPLSSPLLSTGDFPLRPLHPRKLKLLRVITSWRMTMPHKYAIEIIYSDEDEGFIAVVPELPGCSAFGETEEEALREVKVAVSLWLEAAREEGRVIPEPAGRERLRDILAGKGVASGS
jgi:predicted RNase H-like HicB family nuclease